MPERHLQHLIGHNADLILLILFGSAARVAAYVKIARQTHKYYRLADYIVTLVICCFTGVIFGLVALAAGQPEISIMISSAIGSWLGIEGLNRIATILLKGKADD